MKIKLYSFFSSSRLAIYLMLYFAFLVFVVTLDQTRLGIEVCQEKYIESFFCCVDLNFFPYKIPLFGGFFVGALLVVNLTLSLIKYSKGGLRAFGFAMVHASLILLLISGFLQYCWRIQATLSLAENETSNELYCIDKEGKITNRIKLPYSITLKKFTIENWQASGIAKNYSSLVEFSRGKNKEKMLISVNSPVNYGAWTFYQNSFDDNGRISIIGAVKNPVKILPWLSVILVFAGMLVMFSTKILKREK